MTRDEILAMKPGRELDALVAEKVWGLQIHWEQDEWTDPYPVDERDVIVDHFSTDILAAWEVVEKHKYQIDEEKFLLNYLRANNRWGEGWHCVIGDTHVHGCKTAPEAICKAALLAVLEDPNEQ